MKYKSISIYRDSGGAWQEATLSFWLILDDLEIGSKSSGSAQAFRHHRQD